MSERNDDIGSPAPTVTALLDDRTTAGGWILDPAGSRAGFHVKHFWGAVTVHGQFGRICGEGSVGADGTVTGRVSMDAASLSTKNKRRDEHLRSADFFDVAHHPHVVVTVTAEPAGPASLACRGTLEAAGHVKPIEFTAHVEDASARAVTLRADAVVDRTEFAMTWSPLGMASAMARVTVQARFARP